MKQIRVFMAMSALLLAIGGAFASQLLTTSVFEWNGLSCTPRTTSFECSETVSDIACTAEGSSVHLRKDNTAANQCGVFMYKVIP